VQIRGIERALRPIQAFLESGAVCRLFAEAGMTGLKLERKKGEAEVPVVDRMDKTPTVGNGRSPFQAEPAPLRAERYGGRPD